MRWTQYDRGGHFAAMEEPGPLVGDIQAFFRKLREGDRVQPEAQVAFLRQKMTPPAPRRTLWRT